MHRSHGMWRAVVAALGLSMLAVGSLAGSVQAVQPLVLTFDASPGSCVSGHANHGATIRLYDPADSLVDTKVASLAMHHRFGVCFSAGTLDTGWRLEATDGSSPTVKFTIPALSVRVDRVSDVVKGSAPKDSHVTIRAYDCSQTTGTKECPHKATRTVSSDHHGHYRKDMTSAFDLRGYDVAEATWTSSHDHTWSVYQTVPYMLVYADDLYVTGVLLPGQHAKFHLRSHPGGSSLSTRSRTGTPPTGKYQLAFGSDITTGREVSADFATDARMTVPNTGLTFPIEGSDQKIRGHCLPNRKAAISWYGVTGRAFRIADSQGRVYVNLSSAESPGFRLNHTDGVYIYCEDSRGDILQVTATP